MEGGISCATTNHPMVKELGKMYLGSPNTLVISTTNTLVMCSEFGLRSQQGSTMESFDY